MHLRCAWIQSFGVHREVRASHMLFQPGRGAIGSGQLGFAAVVGEQNSQRFSSDEFGLSGQGFILPAEVGKFEHAMYQVAVGRNNLRIRHHHAPRNSIFHAGSCISAERPPSISTVLPVMKPQSGDARKAQKFPTSSAVPMRPAG